MYTEAVYSVALWTRTLSQLWACVKYVPKQSIPYSTWNTNIIRALGMCERMYRSSPFRSTWNTNVITALGMCEVCTEAVHSVALWTRTFWLQHENGFAQQALIHSQKHENARIEHKARKREMTKTRKHENDENAKTRKRENAKTRNCENGKTRKRENGKTRKREDAKTRKPKTRQHKNAKAQKHEKARIEHKSTKTRNDENAKTRKRFSRFLVFSVFSFSRFSRFSRFGGCSFWPRRGFYVLSNPSRWLIIYMFYLTLELQIPESTSLSMPKISSKHKHTQCALAPIWSWYGRIQVPAVAWRLWPCLCSRVESRNPQFSDPEAARAKSGKSGNITDRI